MSKAPPPEQTASTTTPQTYTLTPAQQELADFIMAQIAAGVKDTDPMMNALIEAYEAGTINDDQLDKLGQLVLNYQDQQIAALDAQEKALDASIRRRDENIAKSKANIERLRQAQAFNEQLQKTLAQQLQ